MRILIADDHPLFRHGLRQLLENALKPEILLEAENGEMAIEQLEKHQPHIAILDVSMPIKDGFEVLRHIHTMENPPLPVLLTMYREEEVFLKAMDYGIKGYLLKEDAVTDILRCLESVRLGRFYISASISDYVVRRMNKKPEMDAARDGIDALTPMEKRVLIKVAEMKTSRAIADELFISTKTVNNHRNNISMKLNLQGSHALLKFAIEHKALL